MALYRFGNTVSHVLKFMNPAGRHSTSVVLSTIVMVTMRQKVLLLLLLALVARVAAHEYHPELTDEGLDAPVDAML